MVAGGIYSNGLSNLIILDGSENEFAYAQTLLYYKDKMILNYSKIQNYFLNRMEALLTQVNLIKI